MSARWSTVRGCSTCSGRHIMRGPDHAPFSGKRFGAPRPPDQLGDPEVGDLHPALAVEQDVLGLDIPMHHALVVGELQGLADARDDGQSLFRPHLPVPHQGPQTHPVHVLHQEIEMAVGLPEIVDRHDGRMCQPGESLGLPGESLRELRLPFPARGEHLERDQPAQPGLPGLVHHPHPAPARDTPESPTGESAWPSPPEPSEGRPSPAARLPRPPPHAPPPGPPPG
jgi:hypothetical protein